MATVRKSVRDVPTYYDNVFHRRANFELEILMENITLKFKFEICGTSN